MRAYTTSAETAARFLEAVARRHARRRLTPEERAELERQRVARRAARLERGRQRWATLKFREWLRSPPGRQFVRFARNLAAGAAAQITEDPNWRTSRS